VKRCLTALVASVALALAAGAEVASADGNYVPSPSIVPTQGNSNDQEQIQVVPIAPQANVQNVKIATGDVDQGDANNANTGQASQQENLHAPPRLDNNNPAPAPAPAAAPVPAPAPAPAATQSNDSDQSQIQVVPVAPQLNVQNVNVATHGDVDQGDANNANTGQANQQENSSKASSQPASRCGTCSPQSSGSSQRNTNVQSQIQVVPIAPQANVQNVNVLTVGDVEQGDANNANTGQANQQENSSQSAPARNGYTPKSPCCESKQTSGGQSNRNRQEQIQVVPIAPQLNVQNVNVLTFGEVEQGDANNANTGQANQQENSSKGNQAATPVWKSGPGYSCNCGSKPSGGQSNWSKQKQIQIIPIAPQANFQNVNVLTFGEVEQGDANNANTGQANQQENSRSGARPQSPPSCREKCGPPRPCECKPEPKPEPNPCGCKPEPKPQPNPCECKPEPKPQPNPCECKPEPKPQPNPCECKPEPKPQPNPCECKPEPKPQPKPCECKPAYQPQPKPECGCHSKPSGQSNWNKQKQIQFIPIAPQLNVQNVNVLTLGDVEQGDANNANTGQANQQKNTTKGGGGFKPPAPPVLF
jgi:hypothetical protein